MHDFNLRELQGGLEHCKGPLGPLLLREVGRNRLDKIIFYDSVSKQISQMGKSFEHRGHNGFLALLIHCPRLALEVAQEFRVIIISGAPAARRRWQIPSGHFLVMSLLLAIALRLAFLHQAQCAGQLLLGLHEILQLLHLMLRQSRIAHYVAGAQPLVDEVHQLTIVVEVSLSYLSRRLKGQKTHQALGGFRFTRTRLASDYNGLVLIVVLQVIVRVPSYTEDMWGKLRTEGLRVMRGHIFAIDHLSLLLDLPIGVY
mmetsp:Transcript_17388/g.29119  ORF Transcript_17388/g.29119 Transcript_17388/m.29119 type:complete len:257 (+) Transcript_17388:3183-3953(+)